MALYGADVAQLRTLAKQFVNAAGSLETAAKRLHSAISSNTHWRGTDADRFRSEWTAVSARSITTVVASLRQAAEDLRRNADEQDQASAAGGGAAATAGGASSQGTVESAHGATGLFEHIKNGDLTGDDDGVRIEKVVGPDGKTRLVVYFKGQDTTANRTLARSAKVADGWVDPSITELIDRALKDCPDGTGTDVMLVGLSQGGMDAQNIAKSGRYHVTTMVTYGSPVTGSDPSGVATAHLHAKGDPVPGLGAAYKGTQDVPGASLFSLPWRAYDQAAHSWNHVFESDPGLGSGMQVHENGYPSVAEAFDQSDDKRFTDVKANMKAFEGTTTVVTE